MTNGAAMWIDRLELACTQTSKRSNARGGETWRWTFQVAVPRAWLKRDAALGNRGLPFVAMFFTPVPKGCRIDGLQVIAGTPQDIVTSNVYRNVLSAVVEGLRAPMEVTIRLDLGPAGGVPRRRATPAPRDMLDWAARLRRFGHAFLQQRHRLPTAIEVAEGLVLPAEEAATLIRRTHAPLCREDVALGALPRLQVPGIDDRQEELAEMVQRAHADPTPQEEPASRMRFGIGGSDEPVEEVAREFEPTRERIRPIDARALRKLRHPFSAQ